MRRPLQVLGVVCVALLMVSQAAFINSSLYALGITGLNPVVVPSLLGILLFVVLRKLHAFRDLAGVLSLVAAIAAAWIEWEPLNDWLRSNVGVPFWSWVAPLALGLLVMGVVQSFAAMCLPSLHLRGNGLATFPAWRRVVAVWTNACLAVLSLFAWLALVDWFRARVPAGDTGLLRPTHYLGDALDAVHRVVFVQGTAAYATVDYVAAAMMLWLAWIAGDAVAKPVLAIALRPFALLLTAYKTGIGGSARFLGYMAEWGMQWKPGRLPLGRSTYDGKMLGRKEDRHAIVIAATRSGKFRAFISRILLTWVGSAFIIDPKGQAAAVTARIRKVLLRQTVHICDPFSVMRKDCKMPAHWWRAMGQGGQPYRPARYNPLADIDPAADDAVDQIKNLAAALFIRDGATSAFWDNTSWIVLAGVLAHILVSDEVADQDRHLGTARDYVLCINGRSLETLNRPVPAGRPKLGDLALAAWTELKGASDKTGPDMLLTLRVHLGWLDSEVLRDHLSASDFSMRDLKNKQESVYLVLPQDQLETYACYLRLMATMALQNASKGRKPKDSMLFLMDEFPSLGRLDIAVKAAAASTGSGVMLLPVIQSLSQLQNLYDKSWLVFLSGAGQQIVFGTNDPVTADFYRRLVGGHMVWRVDPATGEWSPYGITDVRTDGELRRETSRASGQALVAFEGGEAMIVRRANYDTWFGAYDPDPYEPGGVKAAVRARRAWAIRLARAGVVRAWQLVRELLTPSRNAY